LSALVNVRSCAAGVRRSPSMNLLQYQGIFD
jgi:hypothetical protein